MKKIAQSIKQNIRKIEERASMLTVGFVLLIGDVGARLEPPAKEGGLVKSNDE